MNGRRSNIEVIADILRLGKAGKTRIMYQVGMSYAQLERYLGFLVERGFLIKETGRNPSTIYYPSQRGLELLRGIERIDELLRADDADPLSD